MMMVMPSDMDPAPGGGDDVEEARHIRRKRSTDLVLTEVLPPIYTIFLSKAHLIPRYTFHYR